MKEDFKCSRCGSNNFISISLDIGYTRVPQCIPCGKVHNGYWGRGSRSQNWDDGWIKR